MNAPVLLNITEAAAYLTERGIPVSVPTLRDWRKTWPSGDRKGPRPILVTPRKLRYRQDECDDLVRRVMDAPVPELNGSSGNLAAAAG